MSKRLKKILMLTVKLLVAVVLLGWVLNQAHWSDYVITKDKKTHALLSAQPTDGKYAVSDGMLWWKTTQYIPIDEILPVGKSTQLVWPGVKSSIEHLYWPLVAVAMAGFLLSTMIVAVRWWFLLRIQEIHIRVWEAVRLTFLGNLFSNVIPGTVGGDLVKAYYVAKHTPRKAAVLVSLFVDRVLGLTELTLLAGVMIAIALAAGLESYDRIRGSVLAVLVVIGLVIGALTFLLSSRLRKMLHLQKFYQRLPIAHHIAAAGDAAILYRQRILTLVKAMGMTFGAHIIWVGSIALLGMSFVKTDISPGMSAIAWFKYFIYIPLIYIIGAVPISFGGVGWVENLYVSFFDAANASTVLAFALLARVSTLVWTLPGVVVALTGPRLPKAQVMEAELEAAEKAETDAISVDNPPPAS